MAAHDLPLWVGEAEKVPEEEGAGESVGLGDGPPEEEGTREGVGAGETVAESVKDAVPVAFWLNGEMDAGAVGVAGKE